MNKIIYRVIIGLSMLVMSVLFIRMYIQPVLLYSAHSNAPQVFIKLKTMAGTEIRGGLRIVDTQTINAWADAGGVAITEGLLKIIQNENELAIILSHEIGHLLSGDLYRGDQVIDDRLLEANADKLGAFIMMRAGFDLCKGKEIFHKFQQIFGDDAITTSHPDLAFRADQLDLPQCH